MRKVFVHLTLLATFVIFANISTTASNWNGIEPLVTSLDDVHVKLGNPAKETDAGPVYTYPWGTVEIVGISDRDIAAGKYKDKFRSKVKGVVVEVRSSTLTPLALGLLSNPDFEKQSDGSKVHFANDNLGITYQFVNDKLTKIFYEGDANSRKRASK
jgi:hypothetical protein